MTFVAFAGDGGTYDIGLQALSGALERGHRFLFVCYDNEAYMNTGIQRSGATPFGASTTTSPAGAREPRQGAAAQGHDRDRGRAPRPYVAQAACVALARPEPEGRRAVAADGPAFINVLTDCPLGWGHEPRLAPRSSTPPSRAASGRCTRSCDGGYRLTYEPEKRVPVEEWLAPPEALRPPAPAREREHWSQQIQQRVDEEWDALVARCTG